jgi:hypothetical protein
MYGFVISVVECSACPASASAQLATANDPVGTAGAIINTAGAGTASQREIMFSLKIIH